MAGSTPGTAEIVTAPTGAPVSRALAKAHLRQLGDAEDELIDLNLAAALAEFEIVTGRKVITQTWKLYLDAFPPDGRAILLPFPPLQSVSSIAYTDEHGDSQTWSSASYLVETTSEPGRVRLAYDQTYPATRRQPRAVTITFVCGYGDEAKDVPAGVRQTLLIATADYYEHRESMVTGTIVSQVPGRRMAMYWPYRVLGADI